MIKRINIIVVFLVFGCFYNMLALKGFMPGIETPTDRLDIIYDVSLALFGGAIIYLITTALPFYFKRKINRDIYKKSFNRFYLKAKNRLDRIEKVDFTKPENVASDFLKLNYLDKPKKGAKDNIRNILIKISSDKELLYSDCIPYIEMAEDHSISEKVKDLAKDNLFMKERIYFKESINENTKIKIGGKLLKFYNELVELEELIKSQ